MTTAIVFAWIAFNVGCVCGMLWMSHKHARDRQQDRLGRGVEGAAVHADDMTTTGARHHAG